MKPITLAVYIIAIVALIIGACGCTSLFNSPTATPTKTTTSNTSPTPPEAAQHDALLERYLAAYQQIYKDHNVTISSREVTWKNSTTADIDIEFTAPSPSNRPTHWLKQANVEVVHFASVDDATNYLNSLDKAYYTPTNAIYEKGSYWPADAYTNVTGHAPSVYKQYDRSAGSTTIGYSIYEISQYDTFVFTGTFDMSRD